MKEVFISFVGDRDGEDDDFRIVGDDYEEVLKHLCLFLNDQSNFPYRFSMKPMINGEEIEPNKLAWLGGFQIEEDRA